MPDLYLSTLGLWIIDFELCKLLRKGRFVAGAWSQTLVFNIHIPERRDRPNSSVNMLPPTRRFSEGASTSSTPQRLEGFLTQAQSCRRNPAGTAESRWPVP